MRLQTEKIYAKDIPDDCFLFLPKTNTFYFVDYAEIDGNNVNLWFEPDADPDTWRCITLPKYRKVTVFNPQWLTTIEINRKQYNVTN